ncbi:uroporphyrinogen-III C-methyltransferase [Alcaligenaceae bacterium CGII-47]|nr:uroporphyrinogen-III C-methyltransferase [Alcaligenaceae bacterium CGII-47]
MTDSDRSTPSSNVTEEPATTSAKPKAATSAPAPKPPKPKRSALWLGGLVLIVLVGLLGAGLWVQHQDVVALRDGLAGQRADASRLMDQTDARAQQALSLAQRQSEQITQLQAKLDATQEQLQDLDAALQLMSDSGSDLLLLNDIDHLVTIAQQQLKLSGNVANAIISLEVAQSQLARANRPTMASLQQTINGDVDRLRAVAVIDLPGLSQQLDHLASLVGEAPLLVPDAAAPTIRSSRTVATVVAQEDASLPADAPWWQQATHQAWQWSRVAGTALIHDVRGLFDIRRVDDATALLISPDQALRFREGLRQRTLTAQLALMMHQPKIWRSELEAVAQAVDRRFDMKDASAREAASLARRLQDTPIETQLPTVDNSIEAIAALREAAASEERANGASVYKPDENAPSDVPADAPSGEHAPNPNVL